MSFGGLSAYAPCIPHRPCAKYARLMENPMRNRHCLAVFPGVPDLTVRAAFCVATTKTGTKTTA